MSSTKDPNAKKSECAEERVTARSYLSRMFLGRDPVLGRVYGPYRIGPDESFGSWLWSICPAIPIVVIGLTIAVFHAYCSITGSIPLWKLMVKYIVKPKEWPKLGGETPEWVMEIPTEFWLTTLLLIVFMRYLRTNSRWKVAVHDQSMRVKWLTQSLYVRLQIMRDAVNIWHRTTRTMLFPAPFCDYKRLGFPYIALRASDEETAVANFFVELCDQVRRVDAKWMFVLHWDLVMLLTGLLCLVTALGSALGTLARFCEGFDLKANGYCQSYPSGENLIRLGHYREWFVNTIVFGLTAFVVYSRIRVQKRTKAYHNVCQTMMESAHAHALSPAQRGDIQKVLQFEIDQMLTSTLTYHDGLQYRVSNGVDERVFSEEVATKLRTCLRSEITWWMVVKPVLLLAILVVGPLGFVNYLLVEGLIGECPEVREKFEDGFYLNHAVGEVAEWMFLFASNVFVVFFLLPAWLHGKVIQDACQRLLRNKAALFKTWVNEDSAHERMLPSVLQYYCSHLLGCSPLVAAAEIEHTLQNPTDTKDETYTEYVRIMEGKDIGCCATLCHLYRVPSLHVFNLVVSALISAVASIISAYGGSMDLANEFYDRSLQGEAGEYYWNCLAFAYTTILLFFEACTYSAMVTRRSRLNKMYAHHLAMDSESIAMVEDDLEWRRGALIFPPPPDVWTVLRVPAELRCVSID